MIQISRYFYLPLLFGLVPLSSHAFSTDFSKGIPEDMVLKDYSPTDIDKSAFSKYTKPQREWYREYAPDETTMTRVGIRAMLSISMREGEEPSDNWLITPPEVVNEGTILTWTAKSIHHVFHDSYDVLISTDGSTDPESFRLLTSVTDEYHMSTRHAIALGSMPELIGKTVRVAFAHRTKGGFMMAITKIAIESPGTGDIWCSGVDRHYFGADDTAPALTFKLHNHGADCEVTDLYLVGPDGRYKGADFHFNSLGEMEATIALDDLNVGDAFFYDLQANVGGETVTIFHDFVNRSHFRRKMLVEKYTASWCNACTQVVFQVERAKHLLGDEMIYVEPHTMNDILSATDYIQNMPYSVRGDYPSLWFNRTKEHTCYRPQDLTAYNEVVLIPCKANVRITEANVVDEMINVTAQFTFAENIDNTSGLIRPAFTVIENDIPYIDGYVQSNGCGEGLNFGAYHFMSKSVPPQLMYNEGVVRESATGSCGDEGYFPAQIEAGKVYEVTRQIPMPVNAYNPKNCEIVTTAVDNSTKTIEIFNADKKALYPNNNTDAITAVRNDISLRVAGGRATINWDADESYTITIYSTEGIMLYRNSGYGNSAVVDTNGSGRIIIIKIDKGGNSYTYKIRE